MLNPLRARLVLGLVYVLAWLIVLALAVQPNLAPIHFGCWSTRQLVVVACACCTLLVATMTLVRDRPERLARWLRHSRARLVLALVAPAVGALGFVWASVGLAMPWTRSLLLSFVGLLGMVAAWSLFVVAGGRGSPEGRAAMKKLATAGLATLFAVGLMELIGQLALPEGRFGHHLNPPNLRARFRTDEFDTMVVTNRQGLRAAAAYSREHPGSVRIVAVGDSMTFGWGVNNDETYPAVAERLLNAREGFPTVEVVNLGTVGRSPVGYLRVLRRYGPELAPDFVVVGFLVGNDCPVWPPPSIRDEAQVERRLRSVITVADAEAGGAAWQQSFVLQLLHSQLRRGIAWCSHLGREGAVGPVWGEPNPLDPDSFAAAIRRQPDRGRIEAGYRAAREHGWVKKGLAWELTPWLVRSAILHPTGIADSHGVRSETRRALAFEWKLCEGLLSEMRAVANTELGAELLVLVIPSAYQISRSYHVFPLQLGCEMPAALLTERVVNDWLAAFCHRAGIHCVDPLSSYRTHADRDTLFFARDAHMTAAGYRLLAESLVGTLAQRIEARSAGPRGG